MNGMRRQLTTIRLWNNLVSVTLKLGGLHSQYSNTKDQNNSNLLSRLEADVVKLGKGKNEHPDIKADIDSGVRYDQCLDVQRKP